MFRTTLPAIAVPAALAAFAALAAPAASQLLFEPPMPSDGGAIAQRALVGDLDEDGLPDAIVNHFQLGPASMLVTGVGGGGFEASPAVFAPGLGARGLADFNRDGHLDLLYIASVAAPLNVSVRLGNGDGTFGASVGVNSANPQPVDADVGDFDGDGALDIAILNVSYGFQSGALIVTLGHGDGTFGAPIAVVPSLFVGFFSGQMSVLRVGDTNGDGLDDIVYVYAGASPVLLSQGDGTFVAAPCDGCTAITERDYLLADVNGDGRDDALTPLRSLLASPGGTFTAAQSFPSSGGPVSVGAGDFDGDGLIDVVIGRNVSGHPFDFDPVGDVLFLRGHGDGTFQTPGTTVSHVLQPVGLTVADVDVDGRLDVVAAGFLDRTPDTLRTLINHTYGPGSPFLDLGGALAGTNGAPIQLAGGTLHAGEPYSFRLANGKPGGNGYHVVGLTALNAPFKGGVLIPSVDLINGPLPLDATGGIDLTGAWFPNTSGLVLYLQFWMPQAGGPLGFTASSGVRAQVP